jgi:lipoate-protein ligase A
MALDHALLRRAATTQHAVLRVYSWSTPTLSFGRHQPARAVYDRVAIHTAGIDVVRRPTGGRAVLHHREVTYSITAPASANARGGMGPKARHVYDAINQLLVEALRALGAAVELADGAGGVVTTGAYPPRPSATPCFDAATPGEVVSGGRKLVGSAQWREGGGILQHGSILIADDQHLVAGLTNAPPSAPVATLRDLLGDEPTLDGVAGALRTALDATLARAAKPRSTLFAWDPETVAAAHALSARYADDAWTWRH